MAWARPIGASLGLIGVVLFARLIYTWSFGVYTLVEDEAHYWEWSRHLGWSYYSKGPGVAWLIRLATELMGTSVPAVRTPAVVASAFTALGVWGMARSYRDDGRVGFVAVAMVSLCTVFQAVSLLMTIDGPYLACWSIACWAGFVSFRREGRFSWLVLGAALALGFLFKYTIVLLVPGLLMYAWVERSTHRLTRRWWLWALGAILIALGGVVPVAIWNAQHEWATVHHLLGHAGLPGGDQVSSHKGNVLDPMGMLEFVGVQALLVGPMLVLFAMSVRTRLGGEGSQTSDDAELQARRGERRYFVWAALPVLGAYAVLSLFTRIEGNWPIAGYLTLMPLGAELVVRSQDRLRERRRVWRALPAAQRRRAGILRRKPESMAQIMWDWALLYGVVTGLMMLRLDLLEHIPWPGQTHPVQRVLARMTEADVRAAHAQRLLDELKEETGLEPVVMTQQYGRASQFAFYLPGHPTTYSASSLLGGRRTQYDEWEHTDLRSQKVIDELRGRPALLVGAYREQWQEAFERVEPIGPLEGERKRGRDAYLGYGFRGFPSD